MTVTLICVGKLKEDFWTRAVAEYEKRLRTLCRLELIELAEQRLPEQPAAAQIAAALDKESEAILAAVPKGAKLIALCVEGRQLDSEAFAAYFEAEAVGGASKLCFVIGGSFGLSEAVKRRAELRLSLSAMTFPHHLARVLLLEQIYRAFMIQKGTRYHK